MLQSLEESVDHQLVLDELVAGVEVPVLEQLNSGFLFFDADIVEVLDLPFLIRELFALSHNYLSQLTPSYSPDSN